MNFGPEGPASFENTPPDEEQTPEVGADKQEEQNIETQEDIEQSKEESRKKLEEMGVDGWLARTRTDNSEFLGGVINGKGFCLHRIVSNKHEDDYYRGFVGLKDVKGRKAKKLWDKYYDASINSDLLYDKVPNQNSLGKDGRVKE